jgi:hypothetical protein
MKFLTVACITAAACAGSQANTPQHRESAPEKAPVAAAYTCGDTVLEDQVTSGGQRLVYWQPCWDWEAETGDRREYTAVATEQSRDPKLAQAEETACANLGPRERERSPFTHKKQIAEVIPHRVAGQLSGVRVVFKPVAGLNAEWMRKDIACHRARWETLGRHTIGSSDPTLVDGSSVSVIERNGHVEVLVETETPEQAEIALARAKGSLMPVTGSQSAVR